MPRAIGPTFFRASDALYWASRDINRVIDLVQADAAVGEGLFSRLRNFYRLVEDLRHIHASVLEELQPFRTRDEWYAALGTPEHEDPPDVEDGNEHDAANDGASNGNALDNHDDAPGDDARSDAQDQGHHRATPSGEVDRGRRTPSPPPARVARPHTPTPPPAYLPPVALPSLRQVLGSPLLRSSRQALQFQRLPSPAVSAVGIFALNIATTNTTGQGTALSGHHNTIVSHGRPSTSLLRHPLSLTGAFGRRATTPLQREVPSTEPASPIMGPCEANRSASPRKDKGEGHARGDDEKKETRGKGKGRAREDDDDSEDETNRKRLRTLSGCSRRANGVAANIEAVGETRYPPCLHPWRDVYPDRRLINLTRLSRTAATMRNALRTPSPAPAAPVVAAPPPPPAAAPAVPAPPPNFVWVAPPPGAPVAAGLELPPVGEVAVAVPPPPSDHMLAPMLALPAPPPLPTPTPAPAAPAPATQTPAQATAPAAGPAQGPVGAAGPASGERMRIDFITD